MSEEEIIENVKYQIRIVDKKGFCYIGKKTLQGLLDLYNKQQKEIESIEEYVNSPEFLDWHLGFTQLDELEYRKNNINKLLEE